MPDGAPRRHQQAALRQATFDVRAWLADLSGRTGWEVSSTRTRRGTDFVADYAEPSGTAAVVTLSALPGTSGGNWELLANLEGRHERIVIPARIRLQW